MSAEEAAATGPSAGQEGEVAQVDLGVYKNPELIESVVVFDPIGGSRIKFLDTCNVYAMGYGNPIFSASTSGGIGNIAWGDDNSPLGLMGPKLSATGSANAWNAEPKGQVAHVEVCRPVSVSNSNARMDVRTATNPINFRFDGVPMILPRESYFEVKLQIVYLGRELDMDQDSLKNRLDGLIKTYGWSRTASSLIQLVSAVDVSATSFQVADITLQNFIEAVTEKDTTIESRKSYYFNSYYNALGFLGGDSMNSKVSFLNVSLKDMSLISSKSSADDIDFDLSVQTHLSTGSVFDVVFRIPLSAISPVFKIDVLPLFLTNSTNVNIQLQVQNPNVGFPLYSFFGGGRNPGTFAAYDDENMGFIPCIKNAGFSDPDIVQLDLDSFTATGGASVIQSFGNSSKKLYAANGGIRVGRPDLTQMGHALYLTSGYTPWMTEVKSGGTSYFPYYGNMPFLYWLPNFEIKAYIKTYASPYNNPLVNRYLRPYLVGPEGAATFFRSAFMSYNFNAMTYTVPGNSSIPFNFNISQTLLNVPYVMLFFSEISIEQKVVSSRMIPGKVVQDKDQSSPMGLHTLRAMGDNDFANKPFTGQTGTAPNIVQPNFGEDPGANCFISESSSYPAGNSSIPRDQIEYYSLMDVFHRSQFMISTELDIQNVQVSIGPSGWNLYQRPLDIKAMNEVTLNTFTRYDSELIWRERLTNQSRFYLGDAFAAFDLSHDMYRGLFIDADNMLNITGTLINRGSNPKTVYIQCILPYIDHFVINLQDSTVTKSQL